ncbi:MAG: DUF760 domain-containing protein [Elainellaceae cyanobacterium]
MDNSKNTVQSFFGAAPFEGSNSLMQYIQSLDSDTIAQLSTPNSEVQQVMEHNLGSLLGGLPPQQFGVTITTSREALGRLLAHAMMNGYFLHRAQQRMGLERSLPAMADNDSTAA